jgi:flagellar biogenesis protein FliO
MLNEAAGGPEAASDSDGAMLDTDSTRAGGETVSASSRMVPRRPQRSAPGPATRPSGGAGVGYGGQLGSLVVVLGVIAAVFWAVRRWVPSMRSSNSAALTVLARTAIGPRQFLALVQVGRRFALVAVSPARVDSILSVDDPQEAVELAALAGANWPGSTRFDSLLSDRAGDFGAGRDGAEPAPLSMRGSRGPAPLADLLTRLRSLRRPA